MLYRDSGACTVSLLQSLFDAKVLKKNSLSVKRGISKTTEETLNYFHLANTRRESPRV